MATLTRSGAQCRKAAVDAEDLPRDPTVLFLQQPLDHVRAERTRIEVHESLVHHGGARREVRTQAHPGSIRAVLISPAGDQVLTVLGEVNLPHYEMAVWDVDSGERVAGPSPESRAGEAPEKAV